MKKFLLSYLSFTKKERIGIISLLLLIVICLTLPYFFAYFIRKKAPDFKAFEQSIADLQIRESDSSKSNNSQYKYPPNKHDPYNKKPFAYENNYKDEEQKPEFFYFDPNKIAAADWKKLGLKEKTIHTIQNYILKGGHFYQKEDIYKIWGLRKELADQLLPYVQIAEKEKNTSNATNTSYKKTGNPKIPLLIDINEADTSAFITLPGIGTKLAQRIVAFREKLGGFYSIEQLAETFGLADSVFQKVKSSLFIKSINLRQVNINTANLEQLKVHPYIRWQIANAIIQYRNQHGRFVTVQDIKKIFLITEEIYNKLSPYLNAN